MFDDTQASTGLARDPESGTSNIFLPNPFQYGWSSAMRADTANPIAPFE
jgi:hypothetical protein